MKLSTSLSFRSISIIILLISLTSSSFAQVGIGTVLPDPDSVLDITSTDKGLLLPRVLLTSTSSFAPLSAHVEGMSVYNTNTAGDVRPGQYYNDGSKWIRIEGTDAVDSVTLSSDVTISSSYPTYGAISGMTLTFTARKTSVLVMLTASGFGFTNSMSIIFLRVRNTTSGTTLGGTMNKIQNYDTYYVPGPPGPGGYLGNSVTTWSASFSKTMTGLTIGNSYSLQVQGAVLGIVGTPNAVIEPATTPDAEHLTLSVMQ